MSAKDKAKDYINEVYDRINAEEQQRITDVYNQTGERLDQEQANVQQQTDANLQRTEVEAQQAAGAFEKQRISDAAKQQAALSMENQNRKNNASLLQGQAEADAEIERMRKLYADIFSSEIKKAQANNDMARAQMLYEAAKAKEAELREFGAQNQNETHADYINKIYDSAVEAQTQEVQQELAAALSELNAEKAQITAKQDESLTNAYVNALKNKQRANEVGAARGTGSGTRAQQALAAGNQTTEEMTELRKVYAGNLANVGMQGVEAQHNAAANVESATAAAERERVQAIYADMLRKGSSGGSGSGGGFDQDIYDLQAQLRKFGYNVPLNGQDSDALQQAYEDALAKGWFNTNRGGTGGNTQINHQQNSAK